MKHDIIGDPKKSSGPGVIGDPGKGQRKGV